MSCFFTAMRFIIRRQRTAISQNALFPKIVMAKLIPSSWPGTGSIQDTAIWRASVMNRKVIETIQKYHMLTPCDFVVTGVSGRCRLFGAAPLFEVWPARTASAAAGLSCQSQAAGGGKSAGPAACRSGLPGLGCPAACCGNRCCRAGSPKRDCRWRKRAGGNGTVYSPRWQKQTERSLQLIPYRTAMRPCC